MGATAPIDFEKSLIAPIDFDKNLIVSIDFDNFHLKMGFLKQKLQFPKGLDCTCRLRGHKRLFYGHRSSSSAETRGI